LAEYPNKIALQLDRGVKSSNDSSCETIEAWLLLLSAIDVPDVAAQLACEIELEARRALYYHDFLSGLQRRIIQAQCIFICLADPENLTSPFSCAPCSIVDTYDAAVRMKGHFRNVFGTSRILENETYPSTTLPQYLSFKVQTRQLLFESLITFARCFA